MGNKGSDPGLCLQSPQHPDRPNSTSENPDVLSPSVRRRQVGRGAGRAGPADATQDQASGLREALSHSHPS